MHIIAARPNRALFLKKSAVCSRDLCATHLLPATVASQAWSTFPWQISCQHAKTSDLHAQLRTSACYSCAVGQVCRRGSVPRRVSCPRPSSSTKSGMPSSSKLRPYGIRKAPATRPFDGLPQQHPSVCIPASTIRVCQVREAPDISHADLFRPNSTTLWAMRSMCLFRNTSDSG